MEGDDTLTFRDFAIDATGKSYGITVRSSATDVAGVNAGKVVVDGMSIANARELGLFYAHPANGSNPTNPDTIGGFEITDSVFADNGQYHTGARGQGHVNLFGFNGDLTIEGSQFHGPDSNLGDPVFSGGPLTVPGTNINPHKAISVSGLRTGTPDVGGYVDSGDLLISNVDIDGSYGSDVVSFYNHQSFASVSITDLDIDARGPWGLVNFDGVGGDIDLSSGITGNNTFPNGAIAVLQGLADANDLEATSGNDVLIGRSGADDLTGGGGGDNLIGGGASDTAHYENTTLSASMFAQVADGDLKTNGNQAGWSITTGGADGTDVIQGIEIVEGLDGDGAGPSSGRMLLVGNGGFATIADALAASVDGDTILIADGTYAGGFTISAEVTLKAAGTNVVIEGPLLTQLGVTGHLNDFMEANHSNYSASTGATIAADNVTIQGLTFSGFAIGVEIGTSTGTEIIDNTFSENITGIRKGTAAVVTGIEISGNAFEYGVSGMNIYGSDAGEFDGVTMNDNVFEHMSEKGMYFEQLSNAVLSDNSFDDVGNYGRISPPFGSTDGEFGQAIDINLKSQNYANVVFNDTIITNSGNSLGNDSVPGLFGAAIGVKIRDDAPSYNSDPAEFTGSIVFNGGSIDGTSTGFRVGEPGKNNQGPDVIINGVLIENASVGDIDNATHPTSGGVVTMQMDDDQGTLDASHSQAPVHVTGTDGAETIIGGTGADQFSGGDGNDIYYAGDEDTIVEALNEGTDEVRSSESITLSANVENLTLLDVASNSETFDDFGVGAISDGENGWKFVGGPRDQAVVDVSGNHMLQISSDPSSGDFAGPYAPDLGASAGESTTTADANSIQVSFTFKAVDPSPGDNSSLEVDFATANRNDRNSFMRIENTGTGLRLAVATPLLDGNWTTGNTQNNFAAFTGNTELISGVDPSVAHSLTMVLTHVDGPDNDVIRIYLDGVFIGQSASFENYRDALGGTHAANAEANQTGGLMFRTSAAGAPTDGAGGQNEGFLFDNVSYSVFESGAGPNGTGNGLANVITGNSGNNVLTGLAGADTLDGGLGNDTLIGGADADALTGDLGDDTFVYDAGSEFAVGETISGGGDTDTVAFNSVVNGDTLTLSAAVTGIEAATLGGSANLNLNVAAVGNGLGITGNGGANAITGTHFADVIAAGAGNDIVNYTLGDGADEVDGGADTDRLAITGAAAASATLYAVTGGASLAVAAGAQAIAASAVEQLALTLGNHGDTVSFTGNMTTAGLLAAAANTAVTGGTGNDLIDASGLTSTTGLTLNLGQGNDTYKMGRGNDVIDGGAGARDLIDLSHIGSITVVDLATGTASGADVGNDSVTGFEDIKGGSGKDFLTGNGSDNTFYASAGDDVINGGGGSDTYDASVWSEATTTNLALGYSSNSSGTSTLTSIENVFGGSGDDFITGTSVANILRGGGGVDTINAGDGADVIDGGANNDVLNGEAGNDLITGGLGNDTINGGAGDTDIAVFAGTRQQYTIAVSKVAGVSTVTVTGPDGTDTLTGVEYLRFVNGPSAVTVEVDEVTDFNMNTSADVLARSGSGQLSYRDGASPGTSVNGSNIGAQTFLGIGDFNGDGKNDVLSTTGSGWYSYASGGSSYVAVGSQSGQTLIAIGDFNADGKDDLLSVNGSGWYSYLNGASQGSLTNVGFLTGQDILGVGDFNGDGKSDILMVNGSNWYSYMSGGVSNISIGFRNGQALLGIGDFNSDGKDDLLFQNGSGWVSYATSGNGSNVDVGSRTGQTLLGIGDFNGDGFDDMLFAAGSGFMSYASGATGGNVNVGSKSGHTLIGVDDFDGDGRDDLLFQNNTTHVVSYASAAALASSITFADYTGLDILSGSNGTNLGDDMLLS
jgi:Ca2+-binding RTX toxin-like protein